MTGRVVRILPAPAGPFQIRTETLAEASRVVSGKARTTPEPTPDDLPACSRRHPCRTRSPSRRRGEPVTSSVLNGAHRPYRLPMSIRVQDVSEQLTWHWDAQLR